MTLLDKPVLFQNPHYRNKIVSLDIETAPSMGAYYDYYKERNIIWKERDWFVMGMGHKSLDSEEVQRKFIWNLPQWKKVFCKGCGKVENVDQAEEILIRQLWEVLDNAQIVIGWNSDKFDIRKLNAKFIKYHLDPPSPYKSIDAMKLHKRIAATETNKLGDVGEFYGLGGKQETEKNLARKCLENDQEAQKEMEVYCDRDVVLAEKIYLRERGWNSSSPYINMVIGKPQSCRNCGGEHFHKHGLEWDGLTKYQRYKCLTCGAPIRAIPDKPEKPYR